MLPSFSHVILTLAAMPRDRFHLVLRAWHCADNTRDTGVDRFFKVRRPMDELNDRLTLMMEVTEEVTTDESTWGTSVRTDLTKKTEGKKSDKGFQAITTANDYGSLSFFFLTSSLCRHLTSTILPPPILPHSR